MTPTTLLTLLSCFSLLSAEFLPSPNIRDVSAMCGPDGITASLDFDRPFTGKIYSLDYANVHECIYYNTMEMQNILFSIPSHRCGTKLTRNTRDVVDTIENRVYVQMDKWTQTAADRQYSFVCEMAAPPIVANNADLRRHPVAPNSQNHILYPFDSPPPVHPIVPIPPANIHLPPAFLPSPPTTTTARPPTTPAGTPIQPVFKGATTKIVGESWFRTTPRPTPVVLPSAEAPSTVTRAAAVTKEYNVVVRTNTAEPTRIVATQSGAPRAVSEEQDVFLEIQYGDGPEGNTVNRPIKIGELLTLVVRGRASSKNPSQYNMFVHSCVATDGPGATKVQLIDNSGCVAAPQVVGRMERKKSADGRDIVYFFRMRAFKFPGPNDVYFSCSVDLSPDFNFPELCPDDRNARLRRAILTAAEADPSMRQIKLYDNVKIELEAEFAQQKLIDEISQLRTHCLTDGLAALLGGAFAFLAASLVGAICYAIRLSRQFKAFNRR